MTAPASTGGGTGLSVSWPGTADLPSWLDAPHTVTHLRLGSSTCPQALPGPDELRAAIRSASERGLGLELATPLAGDPDLARIRELLRVARGFPLEVVVNDWGVLDTIFEFHQDFPIVIGRLLNQQIKDPRIPDVDVGRLGRPPVTWRLGAGIGRGWQRLVRDHGATRAELDWPAQGLDEEAWAGVDLPLSLHLPWALVASGRTCVLRDPRGAVDRQALGEECALKCRRIDIELDPPAEDGRRRVRRGNRDLLHLGHRSLAEALAWVGRGSGPDRIVLGEPGDLR